MILELLFLIFLLLLLGHFVETMQDLPQALDIPNSGDDNERTSITDFERAQGLNVFLLSNAVCRPSFELGVATAHKTCVLKLLIPIDAIAISPKENSNRYAESHSVSSPLLIQPDNVIHTRSTLENRIRKKT